MANAFSAISFKEKLAIRSSYCLKHLSSQKCKKQDLVDAIERVTGSDFNLLPDRHDKMAAALNFRRNLSGRGGRHTWIPVRFGAKCFRNVLTEEQARSLRRFVRTKEQNRSGTRSGRDYLPEGNETENIVWSLKSSSSSVLQTVIESSRSILVSAMSESSSSEKHGEVRAEFDYQYERNEIPSDVSYILYEHDKHHGVTPHTDMYSIFGSVVITIDETPERPLQLYGCAIPLPPDLTACDCIVMDPSVMHEVSIGLRFRNRRSLVMNF